MFLLLQRECQTAILFLFMDPQKDDDCVIFILEVKGKFRLTIGLL